MKTPINAVPCVLCHNLVSLDSAKTDDLGRTIHETCYIEQLLARQAQATVELKIHDRPRKWN
jgi:hypothetical protein